MHPPSEFQRCWPLGLSPSPRCPSGSAHGCKWLPNCTSSQGFGMEVRKVPLMVSAPTAAQKQPVATLPQPGRTQHLIENPQACTTQKHLPAHYFAARHFGCRVCLGTPLRRFTAVAASCRSGAGLTPSPPILHEEADPPPSPPAPSVQKHLTKTPGGNPCHQLRRFPEMRRQLLEQISRSQPPKKIRPCLAHSCHCIKNRRTVSGGRLIHC